MARTPAGKSKSLTTLAAALDTRKRPVANDPRAAGALRDAVKERQGDAPSARSAPPQPTSQKTEAVAKPNTVSKPNTVPVPKVPAPRPTPKVEVPSASTSWRAASSTPRDAALSALQKSPSQAPSKLPAVRKTVAPAADSRRQYPRADVSVKARLSLADSPDRFFEAALSTVNISVGGMFLRSSFFLKMGTTLLVELTLPPKGRQVRVKGQVVRIETAEGQDTGFALRFIEYFDGSEVVLATHFLSPVLREFLTAYAKQHRFDASAEYISHTADVLAAWELKKAELGGDVWSLTPTRE